MATREPLWSFWETLSQLLIWSILIAGGLVYISGVWQPWYERFVSARSRLYFSSPFLKNKIKKRQQQFFDITIQLIAKLAKADGVVCRNETEVAERVFRHELHLSESAKNRAAGIFRQARDSQESFSSLCVRLSSLMRGQPGALQFVYSLLLKTALADDVITAEEEECLSQARRIFRIVEREQRRTEDFASSPDKLSAAYATLGVPRDAKIKLIKKAYRTLVKENHPDILRAQGVSDELIRAARERFMLIQEAYELVLESRGKS